MRMVERWRSDRFAVALTLIAVAGLVLRVAYLLFARDDPVLSDGAHYHRAALFVADGRGFVNPLQLAMTGKVVQDAVHPPAWTVVLALASKLGMRSYLWHQLVAAAIGTATIVMTGLAGRQAFGRRAGLIAATITAVYANIWLYEREVLSEPLAMLGVATILWLAYRFRDAPGAGAAAALGALVALLALTRAEAILLGPLLVTPLVLSARRVSWRSRISWLAIAGSVCVAVIAPWAVYNSTRFERPVPLSSSLGSGLRQGNCPATYSGDLLGYGELGCALYVTAIPDDASLADVQYREAALTFMSDHLSEQPKVMAARVGRTFGFFRPFQQVTLEAERGSRPWVIRMALFEYWALLPFTIGGIVVARRRGIPVYPLLVFPATVVLAVLFTIGAVRYRASAEIPLVLLAAVAIDALVDRWRRPAPAAVDDSITEPPLVVAP